MERKKIGERTIVKKKNSPPFTGGYIFRWRQIYQLTKEDFAHLVGCSSRQVARWEKQGDKPIKMSIAFERAIASLISAGDFRGTLEYLGGKWKKEK